MEQNALEIIKSASYAFYGICAVIAAGLTVLMNWVWKMRKEQKEELNAREARLILREKDKREQALICQNCARDILELQKKSKETDEWIEGILKEIKGKFEEIKRTIKEALESKQ